MKRKSKTFWLIVVPLIAAAIHLALLCLAACIMISMSYPKGAGSPLWAKRLFVVLIWPYGLLYRCNMLGCWIGIGLSFLWMPAVALGAVKVCMLLKKRTPNKISEATLKPARLKIDVRPESMTMNR